MANPVQPRLNGAIYERTAILVKEEGLMRLQACNVFLAGVGGVGGHCAEALVRAGVGSITLCDHDVVSSTNKNRQLIALDSTIGKSKVEEVARRLSDINAQCVITSLDAFVFPEDVVMLLQAQKYTHVVDCIDSVECKIALLEASVKLGIPTFASGGAGGKMDPTLVREADLFDTENDPLSRACRRELSKRGIPWGYIQVVYSLEKGAPPLEPVKQESGGRDRGINGTISYMPPLFGLHLASMVIRHAVDPDADGKRVAARKKHAGQIRSEEERRKREAAAKSAQQPKPKQPQPQQPVQPISSSQPAQRQTAAAS